MKKLFVLIVILFVVFFRSCMDLVVYWDKRDGKIGKLEKLVLESRGKLSI